MKNKSNLLPFTKHIIENQMNRVVENISGEILETLPTPLCVNDHKINKRFIDLRSTYISNLDKHIIEDIPLIKSQICKENVAFIIIYLMVHNNYIIKDPSTFIVWQKALSEHTEGEVNQQDTVRNIKVSDFIIRLVESLYCKQLQVKTIFELKNKDYFYGLNSKLLSIQENDVHFRNKAVKDVKYEADFLMFRFCSHLQMISDPKLNIDETQHPDFHKQLQENGFESSNGMLILRKVLDEKKAWTNTFKCFLENYGVSEHEITKINKDLSVSLKIKKSVSGFPPLKALEYMQKVLEKEPRYENVLEIIKACSKNANSINDIQDGSKLLTLIKDSVLPSLNEKLSIFQIYTANNKHAFYISIQQIADNSYKLVIANGGQGLKMHNISKGHIAEEEKSHTPHQIMTSIQNNNDNFLLHYIYKILALGRIEQGTDSSETREKLLKNIYLFSKQDNNDECDFVGYSEEGQEKKFTVPSNQGSGQNFLPQTYENCTVSNLKNCLKFSMNMSMSEYGIFETDLLLGADSLITDI